MNTTPGIIVYHQEVTLAQEEVRAIKQFYQPERLIFAHDLTQQLPDNTLAVLQLNDDQLVNHGQDASVRFISINEAFAEISKQILKAVMHEQPKQDPYRAPLEKFIQEQHGEIFTIDDVFMHLAINKNDGATHAVPSIIKTLCELGCIKENMLVFTPPQQHTQRHEKREQFEELFETAI